MSVDIDRFVDYDFTTDPEFVPGDITPSGADFGLPVYGEDEESRILTDSEIDAAIEAIDAAGGGADQLVTRIYNQGREGSCVANAFSQANEVIQALQNGRNNVVHLSAISLYKRIGRSPRSGAQVSNGIKEMVSRGILPLDNDENKAKFQHTMAATGFYTPFPAGWEETAKLFRGNEYKVVTSTAALLSALARQQPVVVGREGHSICYLRPQRRNGRRVVKYANSWGNWGDAGFGYDTERQFMKSARWAVAVLTTVSQHKVK